MIDSLLALNHLYEHEDFHSIDPLPDYKELKKENYKLDKLQQKIFDLIENTNKCIFIQGQAGTGKSYLIDYIRANSKKKVVVVSPTALAAINVHGSTIHSLFKLPVRDVYIPEEVVFTRKRANDILLKSIKVLIIDEVSMVRADVLDSIDALLKVAKRSKKPFGGVQLVLVGDVQQLPPVLTSASKEAFIEEYGENNELFFLSKSYNSTRFKEFVLDKVYRQKDSELSIMLGKLRNKEDEDTAIVYFNKPSGNLKDYKNAVTITIHRATAQEINKTKLAALKGTSHHFIATYSGSFEKTTSYPAPKDLELKVGAQVIFTRNDKDGQYVNGTMGIVRAFNDDVIVVEKLDGTLVYVNKEEWKAYDYLYDKKNKTLVTKEKGTFTQYPIELGYAMTIHKAQGRTLDKVIIDLGDYVFAPGQLYVALSRTRYKNDMYLVRPVRKSDNKVDQRIVDFLKRIQG